jgi:ABC-type multidrug transport system fused ATPase/permease subunit
MILGFAILTSVFVFSRIMFLVFATLRASKTLHNRLIEKVLSAPINLFFDVTPIGKILNRFSRDLEMLDESIVFSIGSFMSYMY